MKLILLFLIFSLLPMPMSAYSKNSIGQPVVSLDGSFFADAQPVYSLIDGKIVKKNHSVFRLDAMSQEPDSRISVNYEECRGFTPEELEYIRCFVDGGGQFRVGMLECIEMVFGKAFFQISINIEKNRESKSYYDAQQQTVFLDSKIFEPEHKGRLLLNIIQTLAHELVHAHSDVLMKPVNCYEEGMAVAQTDLAGRLFCQFNEITNDPAAEVFDGPPFGTREYDLLNQEAAAATKGFFWTNQDHSRVVDARERYTLAGTALWKIWRETVPGNISMDNRETYGPGTFFVDFNREFYKAFKLWLSPEKQFAYNDDIPKLVKIQMKNVLQNDKGNSSIEGQEFDDWYKSQHILNTSVNEGPKLFVNMTWQPTLAPCGSLWDACGFKQVYFFKKDSNGNEISLDGKLRVEITSLASQDYGQSLVNQSSFAFWKNNEQKVSTWQEFHVENGNVADFSKTSFLNGALDFSQLERKGCKIKMIATSHDGLYQAIRVVSFPAKLGIERNTYQCFGTIDAPEYGTLQCERSSLPGIWQTIPINGDGTYSTNFAPADILTFCYTTMDLYSNFVSTQKVSVITGTKEMVKNLIFR